MSSESVCNNIRPTLTLNEAIKLVENVYGLFVTNIEEMNGYDDRNYKLETSHSRGNPNIKEIWPHGYVLKIINSEDSKNIKLIEAQNCLMLHLQKRNFNVPTPVMNKQGNLYSIEELNSGMHYVVKLLTFQPGKLLNDNKPSSLLYKNVGKYLAQVNVSLENFHHNAFINHKSFWRLDNVCQIRSYFYVLKDKQQLALIEQQINNFEQQVLPIIPTLEKGVIHGDFNEHNLLTEGEQIKALLDFGDAHYGTYLFEVAICICYMIMHAKDISYGGEIINGYLQRRELTSIERKLIKTCVCARICQSIVLGLHSYEIYKHNYVLSTQKTGWHILKKLTECDDETLKQLWQLKN